MCLIYHMNYEFNNWRAFKDAYEFIFMRHSNNSPIIYIEVPIRLHGKGWDFLYRAYGTLMKYAPEDLREMSIYGWFKFTVTKDENQNLYIEG